MPNALTAIKPHEVSKDLRGYSVLLYGTPKSGKTTLASQFPGALLFAFEKGYNTLPGVMAQPVNSWKEFRNFLIDLRDEDTKEMYQTIVIDTADIAYDYCTEYVCAQEGKDEINDIPYGKGYQLVMREFDKCLRTILRLDYGLVLISHSQDRIEKDENGVEYTQMMPTLDKRGRLVCERTCDIIGLTRPIRLEDGQVITRMFLRETPRYVAGSRFKYMPDFIELSYDNLVNAIAGAIAKEAEETGHKYITAAKSNVFAVDEEASTTPVDFPALMNEFQDLVGKLMSANPANRTKIASIVEEYLGRGRKVSECTADQVPQIELILQELNSLLQK